MDFDQSWLLLGLPVDEITGRGTGLDDRGLEHKVSVIRRAIDANRGHIATPLEALAALGGFEFAQAHQVQDGAHVGRVGDAAKAADRDD